ncbi:MAG: FAD-binding protein [Actinobacteria bacterium]|nr:FAD-binding protein [Actinomycetota bacterium]
MTADETYDIVVVGCGAAGMSTAASYIDTAKSEGRDAKIAILERSTKEERGGSTRWSGSGMRVDEDFVLDPRWVGEITMATEGLVDINYIQEFEKMTPETGTFLRGHGVEFLYNDFPESMGGQLKRYATPNGGGAAIVEKLGEYIEQYPGATFFYETEAVSLLLDDDGRVAGVRVRTSDGLMRALRAEAVMLACGGFEGNYEMLTHYLGKNAVDIAKLVPGTRFNTGDGLRMAQAIGAGTGGQFDRAHVEILDPRTDRPDAVIGGHPYGIVVNDDAQRFYDEGESAMIESHERLAFHMYEYHRNSGYLITDHQVLGDEMLGHFFETDIPLAKADTVAGLALQLGLEPEALEATVNEFNAACTSSKAWNPMVLDGKATEGLVPPKSNWANPINQGPYYGMPLKAAICFTFGGVKTDTTSRVLSTGGIPIPGLYAAGEIIGLNYHFYPIFTSVLRACTFGRVAGAHAAQNVREAVAVR